MQSVVRGKQARRKCALLRLDYGEYLRKLKLRCIIKLQNGWRRTLRRRQGKEFGDVVLDLQRAMTVRLCMSLIDELVNDCVMKTRRTRAMRRVDALLDSPRAVATPEPSVAAPLAEADAPAAEGAPVPAADASAAPASAPTAEAPSQAAKARSGSFRKTKRANSPTSDLPSKTPAVAPPALPKDASPMATRAHASPMATRAQNCTHAAGADAADHADSTQLPQLRIPPLDTSVPAPGGMQSVHDLFPTDKPPALVLPPRNAAALLKRIAKIGGAPAAAGERAADDLSDPDEPVVMSKPSTPTGAVASATQLEARRRRERKVAVRGAAVLWLDFIEGHPEVGGRLLLPMLPRMLLPMMPT